MTALTTATAASPAPPGQAATSSPTKGDHMNHPGKQAAPASAAAEARHADVRQGIEDDEALQRIGFGWRDLTDEEVKQLSAPADDEDGDLEETGQWLGLYQDPAGGGVILACADGAHPAGWTAGSAEDLSAAWHALTGRRPARDKA
jgi:hypothetical protein